MLIPKLAIFRTVLVLCAALFLALASACSGNRSSEGSLPGASGGGGGGGGAARVQGAGATFPNPIYQKWLAEYKKAHPNISIDYQSTGSGAGVKQLSERTIDFGATDSPMNEEELQKAGGEVVHIPTVLGAVVVTYNLPAMNQPLRFSSEVLADIFLGKIKKWDDARIKADNPGVSLPAANIAVVHRSDGSGTTAVFTDYLAKVSPVWKEQVGAGKSPSWPTGQGGKGNEGVSGMIKQQPNTIGYVELAYANQLKLPVALIKNASGNFVAPTLDNVTAAAAEALPNTPEDLRVSITNAGGQNAYPIASYTYVLLYKNQPDAIKGKALVDFLWWGIHDGQKVTSDPQYPYAPLPAEIVKRVEAKLNSINANGKPLRS
ncbi:MAG: phosphate ABC transporter substrate-binding protein PstS [Pyrinomonadaceae bacterium]